MLAISLLCTRNCIFNSAKTVALVIHLESHSNLSEMEQFQMP